jgi:predicted MFS family arabinose efflux permease
VNLPVGILAFTIGFLFLREEREGTAGRFDVPGFFLSGGGLALVLFALSQGPEKGWGSAEVVGSALLGVILFAALIAVETRVAEPMLALRLYGERMFLNANIVLTLTYASFIGVIFLMPLYLQNLRGFTPLVSGLTTFPQAIGVIISSQVVGRLYHRVGPRRLIFFGMLGMGAMTLPLAFVNLGTSLWTIRAIMFGRGLAMSFSFVPLQASTYANISVADTGRASALYSTQRQVAAALGVATLGTVLISRTTSPSPAGQLAGFHAAYLVGAVIVVCASMSALLIRDEDAAATMTSRATPVPAPQDEGVPLP